MDMETQVLQALARGYGHPENSGKVVDTDLIKAMAKEIIESFSPSRESISSIENQNKIIDYLNQQVRK